MPDTDDHPALALARQLHRQLADIHELTDTRSRTPLQDRQKIRVMAREALQLAAAAGGLS